MVPAWGIVVRMRVNMRVENGYFMDDVRMGKQRRTCVITHKERYEKEGYYFL